MNFLMKMLNIREGEGRKVLTLFSYFFLLVCVVIIGKTSRDTYFLSRYNRELLPIMFVVTAVVMTVIITFYNKISKKINLPTLVVSCLILFIVSLVLMQFTLEGIIIPILFVWMDVVCTIPLIQFWTIAGQSFGPREAKRLFGVIGGGGSLAPMVAGMSLKPFIANFGTDELLFVVASLLGLVILLVPAAMSYHQKSGQKQIGTEAQSKKKKVFNPYLKSIAIVIGLSSVVSLLVDYQFKMIASTSLTDEAALASFFGSFFAAAGFVMLIIQFGLTSVILTRFGMLIGLLILPITLMFGAAAILITPVLWAGTLAKFSDQTIKFTINQSVWEILWLPVPPHRKKIGRPLVTGTITSIMIGIGGLITFILTKYIPLQFLSVISVLALTAWIWTSLRLKKQYVTSLQEAVEKRQLNFDEIHLDATDAALVETIEKALDTEDSNQQLFVLELIQDIPLSPWKNTVQTMFRSGKPEVQKAVLSLTIDDESVLPNEDIIQAFRDRGPVSNTAAVTAAHRNLTDLIPEFETNLNSDDPETSASAAAAILTIGSGQTSEALAVIQAHIDDPDPYTTKLALESLKQTPDLISGNQLSGLLTHESADVRAAALDLIQSGENPALFPGIIHNMKDSKTVYRARNALRQFPESDAVSALAQEARSGSTDPELQFAILNTLKTYPTPGSAMIVQEMMDRENPRMYRECVDALLTIGRQIPLSDSLLSELDDETRFIAKSAFQYYAAMLEFKKDGNSILEDHLNHRMNLLIPVMLKLGVLDRPDTRIETYVHTLQSNDTGRVGFALELLEQILTKEEQEIINPLVEPMDLNDRVALGKKFFPEIESDRMTLIQAGIHSGHEWTAALFLDSLLTSEEPSASANIDWTKIEPTPLIQEIVSNHLHQNSQNFSGEVPESFVLEKEALPMYSTIEKTILLKSVNLFKSIPGEDLSRISQIAEEIHYDAGESIFKAGEFGDSMFIVMNGTVKIHVGDQQIAILGKGECLGEMALLDQEPRSADATVEENVILLKISGDAFYEIMSGNMDIMQGIVKLLTGRLRDAIK